MSNIEGHALSREEIERILPHRGRALLLDRVEMIALTLGVAAKSQLPEGRMAYLVSLGEARFPGMAGLGDLVRVEVKITRQTSRMIKGEGKAFVGHKIVAEVSEIVGIVGKIPT